MPLLSRGIPVLAVCTLQIGGHAMAILLPAQLTLGQVPIDAAMWLRHKGDKRAKWSVGGSRLA
jgi:hypothetical protein